MKHCKQSKIFAIIVVTFIVASFCLTFVGCGDNSKSPAIVGEVEITIVCDSVFANYDKLDIKLQDPKFVPTDGIILPLTKVALQAGDSALDTLKKVTKDKSIQLDYSTSISLKTSYVKGINFLYEKSCGELSGWQFFVNGKFANVSCDGFKLKDKDVIKWAYTCDLGHDIGGQSFGVLQNGGVV